MCLSLSFDFVSLPTCLFELWALYMCVAGRLEVLLAPRHPNGPPHNTTAGDGTVPERSLLRALYEWGPQAGPAAGWRLTHHTFTGVGWSVG